MAYSDTLLNELVRLSSNELFYMGNSREGAKVITSEVSANLKTDRASIWLFNEERDAIVLQQLWVSLENTFYQGIPLYRKDFEPYFLALEENPIIVADDAETHPATSCFLEGYLKPLGIKSMLDVPIWYRGSLIGVICIESLTPRKWLPEEINFAQVLSSLYSFSYSVKEANALLREIREFEVFVDKSVLVSRTDSKGRITYVNKKFTEVSGWSLEEALGKDHSIVNSGLQKDGYWADMYKTVLNGKIWNDVVANKTKSGDLYYVDTYIKADFNEEGNLEGFVSIRQDVTDIAKLNEQLKSLISSQTTYVLRTDMQGRHTYWNEKFEDEFGWVYEGNMMHGDSLLSICESHHDSARDTVMKCIAEPGKIVKVELDKPHRDGNRRTTLWEFVCLTDKYGNPVEVQCMGIDITERVNAEKRIIEVLHDVERKNVYLEHAAKILRHDMHSGINTYIPRGIKSLERRLDPKLVEENKLEAPLKMLKEGLKHAQKVYQGVYEFTNLVKKDVVLYKEDLNIKHILDDFLSFTAYKHSVKIEDIGSIEVNESLFCTAIDNLIRNGLKYNDSNAKLVIVSRQGDFILVEDNGRGLTSEEFKQLSKPYVRKEGQLETGTGLGLNICIAILEEHGFTVDCEKREEGGTRIKINLKND
jgi:PAS domain S-box-containing protein